MNRLKNLTMFSGALALVVAVATAGAQGNGAGASGGDSAGGLEEVVVTARRKEENLQEVPLSITALTADTLDRSGVDNLFDLNALAPGLNYQNAQSRFGTNRLNIRGLTGGTAGLGKASAFIDGIWMSGSIGDIDFGSLERIEVLQGPQSAHFGRATFSGALNYITKDPTASFQGRAQVEAATDDEQQARLLLSGPLLGERLLGLVNVFYNSYGGPDEWQNFDGRQQGNIETTGIMAKLVANVTDDLRIEARVNYTETADGQGMVFVVDPRLRDASIARIATGASAESAALLAAIGPAMYPSRIASISESQVAGGVNLDTFADPGLHSKSLRTALEATWSFGGGYTLAATATANREESDFQQDGDSTTFANFGSALLFEPEDKAGELRLISPQERRLRWEVGVYYLDFKQKQTGASFLFRTCLTICTLDSPGTSVASPVTIPQDQTAIVNNWSQFGAVYFDISDAWTLSVEGRYQNERIVADNRLGTGAARYLRTEFSKFLPRVNLQWKVRPDLQVYGLYSEGNNPGGFNADFRIGTAALPTTTEADRIVDEEKLVNYEIGFKSEWLDQRLLVNGAIYHMKWEDQVIASTFTTATAPVAILSLNKNLGTSTIDGAQLEVQAVASERLTLRGTLSYNRSEYDNFCSTNLARLQGFRQGICVDVGGNTFDANPRLTGTLGAEYSAPVNADWTWTLGGNYEHQDGQWDSEMNLAKSEATDLFNLTFGLGRDNLRLEAYCRNCAEEDAPLRVTRFSDVRAGTPTVIAGVNASSNLVNQTVGLVPRRPRQFGIKLTYDF